ncbi:MAG TPA: thioesterase family protein [Gemmatimonadaceae bacterium]|nr:thioesterase family protein [Gemmatimonadaceae bacterium]
MRGAHRPGSRDTTSGALYIHGMSKTPFVVAEYVRWGDIDLAGIICYGAYIRFYELAETEIFRACGLPFREMFERYDIWLPRKVMHTEFYRPARLDDRLEVVTYFSRVGESSLTINFDVLDATGLSLHAAAYQVLVCVSRRDFAKVPLPAGVVQAVERYVMDSETAREAGKRWLDAPRAQPAR